MRNPGFHHAPHRAYFFVRNRGRTAGATYNFHDPLSMENEEFLLTGKAGEAILGEQRPLYPFLPIFPLAHSMSEKQKRFDLSAEELIAHDFLGH